MSGIRMLVILFLLLAVGSAWAGNIDSPGDSAEGSGMYSLEELYDYLNFGIYGIIDSEFVEPDSGPAPTGRTLTEIYQSIETLFNQCTASPGQVAVGVYFFSTNPNSWGPKVGTMALGQFPAPVPRTGQTPTAPLNPAPAGSDGAMQKGVPWPNPRFTDNGNGTVMDNLTGLIWLKDASCAELAGTNSEGLADHWDTALAAANALSHETCGLSDGSVPGDWRLPHIHEINSLIDWRFFNPAVSNTAGTGQWIDGDPFTGVKPEGYWSSTTDVAHPADAWLVYLSAGSVYSYTKDTNHYVWPVRGGQ